MGGLEEGTNIHQRVVQKWFSLNIMVINTLIYMYEKCTRINKVKELLEKIHDVNIFLWNAVIGIV